MKIKQKVIKIKKQESSFLKGYEMTKKNNDEISLLNQAINLYSGRSELAFCEIICIKGSIVRTWRLRGSVPDDKIVLLKTLICVLTRLKQRLLSTNNI